MERIESSEGHTHAGDSIGRDNSGQRKHRTEQGALTSWRRHREGQVRTQKESDPASGTHFLETASGWTSQDMKGIRPSEGRSRSQAGDGVGRDKSGHRRIRPSEGHSRTGHGIGRDKSGHGKNRTERGILTYWRRHREGQVRTEKASDRARCPHQLETASGRTSQETERIRPSERHSLPGDGIGWDKSGQRKNPTQRGTLTLWRRHRDGQFRRRK